jgi:thioredoxin-related protein
MKKVIAIAFFACTSICSQASEFIKFSEATWNDVTKQASSDKKYVFLDCYTDWCYWCKVMDKEAFVDTSVTNFINKNFIPTKREMEKDAEGIALTMKYHINGFPTYCIFSPDGNLVHKIIGYRTGPQFLDELKTALTKTTPLVAGFNTQIDPGFPQFYKDSFGTSKKRKMPETKTVTDFLDTQKDLFSEVSWAVMWRFKLTEKYENWILENRVKLIALYGAEEVESKMVGIFSTRNTTAAEKKDEAAFKANLAAMQQYLTEPSKSLYTFTMSQAYYRKSGNWKSYVDLTQSFLDTSTTGNDGFINGCAWTIYEESDDKYALDKAVAWMEKVCARTDEYAYEDTYASVLYKKGEYKKAEEVALHAIELGKAAGEDVSGTDALLANIRLKIK